MLPLPSQPDPLGDDFDLLEVPNLALPDLFGHALEEAPEGESPLELSGRDLERFTWRLDQSLERARQVMTMVHRDARRDRNVYRIMRREQEYEGQPNLTTPMAMNKVDGWLAQAIDAIEQRPLASFVAEGIGEPAERAAQVAPVCAAYLEREINRGGSRELIVRDLAKEAAVVGTAITKLAMVTHPSGEMFAKPTAIIQLEDFFVDRLRVPNLKHCFSAYREHLPFYVIEEMADNGLLDPERVARLRATSFGELEPSEAEKEVGVREQAHSFQEETAVHELYWCYMRFRPETGGPARLYEAVWDRSHKVLLAVRENPVREAFDHPPIALVRIGKTPGFLLGRGIVRRLDAIQEMSDNAVNTHLALNHLAAAPPFVYNAQSPFGRLMESKRRLLPGVGIPSVGSPKAEDVRVLQFPNPGLALQDVGVAQTFADRATYTEEAIGTSSARKTLGQFRVEVQRGTMRIHLDLGDLAYDLSTLFTMLWSMAVCYKVVPAGVVEVEEGGRFLAARDIERSEIEEVMDALVVERFNAGDLTPEDVLELEAEFNRRLTNDIIPSARRSDLTIRPTGTKVIADKATELEMLAELTPYVLQGIDLARRDTYWNYHLRSMMDAMGFKDIDKRMPPDPGQAVANAEERMALGQPLAETIRHSSNMV